MSKYIWFIIAASFFLNPAHGRDKPVIIQATKFPQHFKVAIKWKQKIPYQVEQKEDEMIVVFDRDTDFHKLGFETIPSFIKAVDLNNIEGSFVAKLKVSDTAEIKHYWKNGNFTLSVLNSPLKKSKRIKVKDVSQNAPNNLSQNGKPSEIQFLQRVHLHASLEADIPQLIFDWDKPIKAAAIHWGEHLFIAFDAPAVFDRSGIESSDVKLFKRIQQLDVKGKAVIILPLASVYKPTLIQDKDKWVLRLHTTKQNTETSTLKVLSRKGAGEAKSTVTFLAPELGTPITLEDPETGLPLSLIPSSGLISRQEKYPVFNILPPLMGVALLHKGPSVSIKTTPSGFSVHSETPLYVSSDQDITKRRIVGHPDPLLRIPTFTPVKDYDFHKTRLHHEREINRQQGEKKQSLRFELVNFYLYEGYFKEALGELKLAAEENQALLKDPKFRALRALVAILDGDDRMATQDIHSAPLAHEADADFLKALYQATNDRTFEKAFSILQSNKAYIGHFPPAVRNKIALIAAETAVMTHNDPLPFLDLMDEAILIRFDRELKQLYQALGWQRSGKKGAALKIFSQLKEASNPEVAVRAALALVKDSLHQMVPNLKELITQLEAVRFKWTGDDTEFNLYKTLGDLYIRNKDYTQGLRVLREAYQGLPHVPRSKELHPQIVEAFSHYILKEKDIKPFDLVVFYQEFKGFTPEDHRKTLIHLKMVEAYLTLDLLENAARDLEKLVQKVENKGIRLNSKYLLADVYIRDNKPKKALDLMKSDDWDSLSQDLQKKKFLLTFKALSRLQLYDQAQDLIEQKGDNWDTNLQRLELAWQRKDWRIAQNILSSLVHPSSQHKDQDRQKSKNKDVNPELVLSNAIAAYFNDDLEGLAMLRDEFMPLMKASNHGEAFEIITNPETELELTKLSLAEKLSDMKTFQRFIERIQLAAQSTPPKG